MSTPRILIVNPPFYRLQGESLIHYPPGCCYVAASLEQAGFESEIYNADYDPEKKTLLGNTNHINVKALLRQHADYQERLAAKNDPVWLEIEGVLRQKRPDILIVSVFTTTLTAGTRIARMAREVNPGVKVIFEGCFNRGLHCAVDPGSEADYSVVDFGISNEPEIPARELLKALSRGETDFSAIPGLTWKRPDGAVVRNEPGPYVQDLDSLPFPARHRMLDADRIPPHAFQGIYGSRGCPFDCVFCGCHTSMGYKPRTRSAQNIVDEIEQVHKRFGTRYFYLCDDIFFISKDRAQEFCERLIKKRLPVYFSAQTRAELVDEKTLALVKRAGGQHIAVGVEVGNPDIRKLIRKGNTVDDVRKCARMIRDAGLRMVAFTMVGLPWEGEKEIRQTVDLIKEIKPYIVFGYMPTPAAGTELKRIVEAKNPSGLEMFHDTCHIDASAGISINMSPEERRAILEWALDEFTAINKKSLFADVFSRPGFYWALAHDMGFFKRPGLVFKYLKDYLS